MTRSKFVLIFTFAIMLLCFVMAWNSLNATGKVSKLIEPASVFGKKSKLEKAILESIPEPSEKEFPTAESVFKRTLEAIKDRNVDEFLKCCPIRLRLEKFDFEYQVRLGGYFDFNSLRLPNDALFNIRKELDAALQTYYDISFSLLLNDNRVSGESIDLNTKAGKSRLDEIAELFKTEPLAKIKIGSIEFDKKLNAAYEDGLMKSHKIAADAMNANKVRFLEAKLRFRETDFDFSGTVFLIEGNWRLYSIRN